MNRVTQFLDKSIIDITSVNTNYNMSFQQFSKKIVKVFKLLFSLFLRADVSLVISPCSSHFIPSAFLAVDVDILMSYPPQINRIINKSMCHCLNFVIYSYICNAFSSIATPLSCEIYFD